MTSAAFRTRLLHTGRVVPPPNGRLRKSILILGKRDVPPARVRVRR
jgi:hypothetical protein